MDPEPFRAFIGGLALLCAGSQMVMRHFLVSKRRHDSTEYKKERSTAVAATLMLLGVGLGNLTHLKVPITFSTVILTIAVLAVAYNQIDLWRAVEEKVHNEEGESP